MPHLDPHNEPALLPLIAEGDTNAFARLYHLYSGQVYNTVMVYVKDAPEAEEIVQQVFVKLWERRASLTAVTHFPDYFFILVRNTVFNYFNGLSRQARLVRNLKMQTSEHTVETADYPILQKQYEHLVERAIRQLPDRQKQVYRMADGEALSYDDIARRMQISRFTAKKHMELARKAIREYVSRHLQDRPSPLLPMLIFACLSLL